MRYTKVRYVRTKQPLVLELYNFDGTYRLITFRDEYAAADAMNDGRADMDCSAVEQEFLPYGATLVSGARVPDDERLLQIARDTLDPAADPLDIVRLRFSIQLLADRSCAIDAERDRMARATHTDHAERYDRYCRER